VTDVLGQWDAWIGEATDRLMDLDGRAAASATDQVRLDLAAAFVCRKAIADRVEQIRATPKQAAALAAQPVLDDRGELVGRDIAEAATLLGKVLDRVAATIDRDQQQQSAILADAARATTDLATATRLSEELGEMGNRVAAARTRFEAAGRDPDRLRAAADDLAAVRADLVALDTERSTLLQRLADLPARLDQLRTREAAVREVAARCREKVTPAPRIAVPSVDALGPAPTDAELAGLTWPVVRGKVGPVVEQVERFDAALAEAERRFTAALTERDDLRGLLQAFRDKAGEHGIAERADIDGAYQAARDVLWSAPCDLVAARSLTQTYSAAVNASIAASREVAR
jgi:hypothetical protein